MIAIRLIFYVTSSINTQEILAFNVHNQSLLYHNAINIINLLIYKYCCCVTMQIEGDVSPSIRSIFEDNERNVLSNKLMKIVNNSKSIKQGDNVKTFYAKQGFKQV